MYQLSIRKAIRLFKFTLIVLTLFVISCISPQKKIKLLDLPQPDFEINYTRSDPDRPVREKGSKYKGPIFDAHVHLDPSQYGIDKEFIREVAETLNEADVFSAIFMPVPNEGHMAERIGKNGPDRRRMLKKIGGSMIKLFCGSEYISNRLHQAYNGGYAEGGLDRIYEELSSDLDDPECSGIGEVGLYHFNKTGSQNIIQYPPSFKPYYRIISMIAEKGSWLDLHAEPVDPFGKSYEEQVFGGLKMLLTNFPDLKLILSHTAMTNPKNLRAILQTYPGIMVNFKPIRKHNKWRNLEPITNSESKLYEDWAVLFEEMPERFMVGSDFKFGRSGKGNRNKKYAKGIRKIRKLLGSLEPETAKLIAYENARMAFE